MRPWRQSNPGANPAAFAHCRIADKPVAGATTTQTGEKFGAAPLAFKISLILVSRIAENRVKMTLCGHAAARHFAIVTGESPSATVPSAAGWSRGAAPWQDQ